MSWVLFPDRREQLPTSLKGWEIQHPSVPARTEQDVFSVEQLQSSNWTCKKISRLESKGIIHAIRNKSDMQEATGAYKDIEQVIAQESDLVQVRTRLLPVAVIKG